METAFFNTTVECPICKKENRFETIRVGAYVESGRDTDFCPLDIKWRFPEHDNCNPLVFFVATCPNCLYSRECNDAFKNWQRDTTFKTYRLKRVKERHLEELAKDGSIVKQLGDMIDVDKRPDETAVARLLLAVFDEKLNERPSNLDLGRLYIRIGWVFRAMGSFSGGVGSQSEAGGSGVEVELTGWISAMRALRDSRQALFDKVETVSSSAGASGERITQLREAQETIIAHEAKLFELVDVFSKEVDVQTQQQAGSTDGAQAANGGASDIFSSMASLKQKWDGVPLNEREALKFAAECYQSALEDGKEVSAGNQQVQVCYLIAELSRRIGKHDQARDFFNSALKVGQEFVRRYQNDTSRTALARKILELAMEQSQINRDAQKEALAR
jgi:tetratricopeptide (TPR) repeat protein